MNGHNKRLTRSVFSYHKIYIVANLKDMNVYKQFVYAFIFLALFIN